MGCRPKSKQWMFHARNYKALQGVVKTLRWTLGDKNIPHPMGEVLHSRTPNRLIWLTHSLIKKSKKDIQALPLPPAAQASKTPDWVTSLLKKRLNQSKRAIQP